MSESGSVRGRKSPWLEVSVGGSVRGGEVSVGGSVREGKYPGMNYPWGEVSGGITIPSLNLCES